MAVNLTDMDIGTRYALQEDFNNGFVGRDRQVVIQTDDPKGYRPVIMDGTTQGGKSKVALLTDLSDYVPVDTYNSEKAGFATKSELSSYATKTELTSGLAGKQPVGDYATNTALTQGLAGKLDATAKAASASVADSAPWSGIQTVPDNVVNALSYTAQELTEEQKKQVVQNLVGTFLPLSGGALSGNIVLSEAARIVSGDSESTVRILGGTDLIDGAFLELKGINNDLGSFAIHSVGQTKSCYLYGNADVDSLTWNLKEILRVDSTGENWIRFINGLQFVWGINQSKRNIIFSVPFKSRDSYVIVGMVNVPEGAAATGFCQGTRVDGTQMYLRVKALDGRLFDDPCLWLAIGYWK